MTSLRFAGVLMAGALALSSGTGVSAAVVSLPRPAPEASRLADGLILRTQPLGMQRRHDRRMNRHERRMDRQVNRQERRMDRHDRRMERRY